MTFDRNGNTNPNAQMADVVSVKARTASGMPVYDEASLTAMSLRAEQMAIDFHQHARHAQQQRAEYKAKLKRLLIDPKMPVTKRPPSPPDNPGNKVSKSIAPISKDLASALDATQATHAKVLSVHETIQAIENESERAAGGAQQFEAATRKFRNNAQQTSEIWSNFSALPAFARRYLRGKVQIS